MEVPNFAYMNGLRLEEENLANHTSPPPLYFHMPLPKIVVSAYSHQNFAVQIRHYFSC
jgi:hypothetical protein